MTTERREMGTQGRRATDNPEDRSDGRVVFLERHFADFIDGKFDGLKTELVQSVEAILKEVLANLPERVSKLEGREFRVVVSSVISSMVFCVCLLVAGKVAGWWL